MDATRQNRTNAVVATLCAGILLALPRPGAAASFEWVPGTTNYLDNPANWIPGAGAVGGYPAPGDTGLIANFPLDGATLVLRVPAGSFGDIVHSNTTNSGFATFDVLESASFTNFLVSGNFTTVSRIQNNGAGDVTLSISGADPVSIGNFGTYGQLEVRGSASGTMSVEIANNLWLNGASSAVRVLNDAHLEAGNLTMGAGNAAFSATLEMQGNTASAQFGAASIGATPGSMGIVQLGDQAQLSTLNDFRLGVQGFGALEIRAGASAQVGGRATLGDSSGSTGNAIVSGAGSTWQQQELIVGNQGSAMLAIEQGAQVTTGSFAAIGTLQPAIGIVSVSTGGRWEVNGEIYVGFGAFSGSGNLLVDAGGTVSATRIRNQPGANSVTVANGGTLALTHAADPTLYNQAFARIDGDVQGNLWNQQGGLVTGSGTIQGDFVLDTNSSFSPGASPGTLAVAGNSMWWGDARYLLDIGNATGTAGVDWDLVTIDGDLDVAATAFDPFSVVLLSTGEDGLVDNFDPLASYSWQFASFSAISGFDAAAFALNTAGFANPFSGTFAVHAGATGLYLDYVPAPAPEPATLWLLAAGGVTLLLIRKRPGATTGGLAYTL